MTVSFELATSIVSEQDSVNVVVVCGEEPSWTPPPSSIASEQALGTNGAAAAGETAAARPSAGAATKTTLSHKRPCCPDISPPSSPSAAAGFCPASCYDHARSPASGHIGAWSGAHRGMVQMSNGDGSDRLTGWKAIATHFGRDERTVKRWEAKRGMPVRRVAGASGSSVYASAAELDGWMRMASVEADAARVPD